MATSELDHDQVLGFDESASPEEGATGAKLSLVEHLDKLMGHQQSGYQA